MTFRPPSGVPQHRPSRRNGREWPCRDGSDDPSLAFRHAGRARLSGCRSELPSGGALEDAEIDRHPVQLDGGARPVPVYDRAKLSLDLVIAGPALVVQLDSTTLIAPDQTARVDRYSNLLITFQEG